jgi:hypothetical protein
MYVWINIPRSSKCSETPLKLKRIVVHGTCVMCNNGHHFYLYACDIPYAGYAFA